MNPRTQHISSMRLKRLLSFFAVIFITTAPLQAQNERILFPANQLTFKAAISEIEKQTDYIIVISNTLLDNMSTVSLGNRAVSLKSALDQIFAVEEFEWTIRNKYIIVSKKENKAEANETFETVVQTDNDFRVDKIVAEIDRTEKIEDVMTTVRYDTIIKPGAMKEYPLPYSAYLPASEYSGNSKRLPRYAIKANLLYGGVALTPNLAFEVGINDKSTIELSGGYSWWGRKKDASENHKQFAHYSIRSEYRHWLCERFNGHYFGGNVSFSKYYVSGYKIPLLFKKDHSYDGWALSAGVDYGYHLVLAKHWGLDFNIGAGYARMDYKKGDCAKCDPKSKSKVSHYFGPTRAGITLTFMIK